VISFLEPELSAGQDKMAESWEELVNKSQPPGKIMDAIGLKPGMIIGEVGAGRGRFTVRLAKRVGPQGFGLCERYRSERLELSRPKMQEQ